MSSMLAAQLRRLTRSAALLGALILPLTSHAIVGGAGIDPNTASSPWAGVGSVQIGSGRVTGALIAPGYVLTAAHAVYGQSAANVSFILSAGATYTVAASQIFIDPGYVSTPGADGTVHNDLAIIRLDGTAPAGVPYYNLYAGTLNAHDVLTFVGFAGTPDVKRTGENRADYFLSGPSGNAEVYLFDYDGPDFSSNRIGPNVPINGTLGANREASLSGGDSGSPAFFLDPADGTWKLAAVNTFVATFSNPPDAFGYGSGGGGQVLSAYADWINSVITTPVPEPGTYALMLAGLGLLGFAARRRKVPETRQ